MSTELLAPAAASQQLATLGKNNQGALAGGATGALYLAFRLAAEVYAIDILGIREIIEYGAPTSVPMMPPSVRGVINLRGAVVPVIDLAVRFGREATGVGKRTCIVIVEVSDDDTRHDIGILVDAVSEVLDIPDSEIEPPPAFGAKIRADFISGMGKVAGKFVIILSINKVLSVDEIALLTGSLNLPGEAPLAGCTA